VLVLVVQTAQLAAAPLTKTIQRERAVTFIDPPFMTFNLSMLMKRGNRSSQIDNMLDLSNQDVIKYGIVAGGATEFFFSRVNEREEHQEYTGMWYEMDSHWNRSLLESVEVGVRRVRESDENEPFAFIGERHMIEYHASRAPCDLVAIPTNVRYQADYHLAISRNVDAPTRDLLGDVVLTLKNTGRLDELYNKWWTDRDQCSQA